VRQPDLRNCERIPGAHFRISRLGASRDCGFHSDLGPFADECAFELGKCTQHLRHQHALSTRSIDWIQDGSEIGSLFSQAFNDFKEMRKRTCQSINPNNHKRVAMSHAVDGSFQIWAITASTACGILKNSDTAIRSQCI
jgi:hypothetical protein